MRLADPIRQMDPTNGMTVSVSVGVPFFRLEVAELPLGNIAHHQRANERYRWQQVAWVHAAELETMKLLRPQDLSVLPPVYLIPHGHLVLRAKTACI